MYKKQSHVLSPATTFFALIFLSIAITFLFLPYKTSAFTFGPHTSQLASVSSATNINLKAYWDFNKGEGSSATDVSLKGHTGAFEGSPSWVSGREGNGLSFVEGGSFVRVKDSIDVDLTTSLTLVAWVKLTDGEIGGILTKEKDPFYKGAVSYDLSVVDGKVQWKVGDKVYVTDTSIIEPNVWTHIILTYQTSASPNLRLFVNGDRVYSTTATTPIKTSGDFLIGTNAQNQSFPGVIDEVQVHKRTFLDTEARQLYNAYSNIPVVDDEPQEEVSEEETPISEEALKELFAKLAQALKLVEALQEALAKLQQN